MGTAHCSLYDDVDVDDDDDDDDEDADNDDVCVCAWRYLKLYASVSGLV